MTSRNSVRVSSEGSYLAIFKKTWPLLVFNSLVVSFIASEYINLIFLSDLLWPGDNFHGLQMGALISVRLWVDGGMALLWGSLADRISRKKLFTFTSFLTGIMIILNSFLPIGGGNRHYVYWLIARALIGVFMSAGGPIMHSLASDLLPKTQRSRYFGMTSIVWGAIPPGFSLLSAFLFQRNLWRQYYFAIGLLYLGFGIYMYFFFKEPKRGLHEAALTTVLSESDVEYSYTISKETLKSTLLSKTNLLVFAEGIFSNIFFGILDLVLLPYIQDSPRNLSPTNSAVLSIVFGIPGALIGPLVFGKIADKYGARNLKNRIWMIIISLSGAFLLVFSIFIIQLPHLSESGSQPVSVLWRNSGFLIYGAVILFARIDFSLFMVNQPAIIQEINLPEAQGTIRSWGQLVEIAAYGMGPILAGFLLTEYANDYKSVIIRMVWLLLPGLIMWLLTLRTVQGDRAKIQQILEIRAAELQQTQKEKKTLGD